ncbi:MAG: hypothetical protein A2033_10610 [Bacteroidetes bacterium GWA2_31_9]|nr:MAG: hypothetical protein A2033_10610 [Bacteroidetes bacterium GWA2_31_9]
MKTLTVEVMNENALRLMQNLELNKLIRIIKKPKIDNYSLSGDSLSISEFKKWINDAENAEFISLSDAKNKWEQISK